MPFISVLSFDIEFPPKKCSSDLHIIYIYVCVCIKYFKNLTGTAAILIAKCLNATVNYVLHRLLNLVRILLFLP